MTKTFPNFCPQTLLDVSGRHAPVSRGLTHCRGIIYATDLTQETTEQLQTVSHPGITIHTHRVTDKKTKGRVNIPD